MRIGVTGHQKRTGICWSWVRGEIARVLAGHPVLQGYSSLAEGVDQIFAEEVISVGGSLVAVIPVAYYEHFFDEGPLANFKKLISKAEVVNLKYRSRPELAFMEAGHWIVRKCDLIIAVWDGEVANGLGGTADTVRYAQRLNVRVLHINPIDQTTVSL